MRRGRRTGTLYAVLLLVITWPGHGVKAEVVHVRIERREPFADGYCFGRTGPYEKVVGRLYYEVDPDDPLNARVTGLQRAPRNKKGKVEFWSDFFMLKPADSKRGNRRLLYDVHNRGNKLAVWIFNEGPSGKTTP